MIRYAIVLIFILLFRLNSYAQLSYAMYSSGDKRIAFKDSTMLIVGGVYDGKKVLPCYWRNNKKVMLGNEPGYVSGIFIEEDNVYMSGFILQDDFSTKPCYWLNDSLVLLPEVSGWAYSVIKNNSDIYLAGVLQKGYESYPCYWKNGRLEKLSEMYGEATSIFASNNGDLYFSGTTGSSLAVGKAVYWKNGKLIKLSKIGSEALSILVSNDDIYVIGAVGGNRRPTCWKNGEKYKLVSNAQFISTIRGINGDIYIGGSKNGLDFKPCYWKNGELNSFNNAKGTVISIEEHNSEIYFLSLHILKDKLEFSYWKNGEKVILEN